MKKKTTIMTACSAAALAMLAMVPLSATLGETTPASDQAEANVTAEARSDQPNVVFILLDDVGWRDFSSYGSTYFETPNIDRLASQGVRFTKAYSANPLCSPSRAAIITGLSPARLGLTAPQSHLPQVRLEPFVRPNAGPGTKMLEPMSVTRLSNDYVTYAEVLKDEGYATAFIGKWHLGKPPYVPQNQGFDLVVGGQGTPGPPGGYFAPFPRNRNLPQRPDGTHISDMLAEESVKFMRANKDKPFLLNLWTYDVHAPFQAKEELVEKYRAKTDPQGLQKSYTYAAMIETMDTAIGTVLDEIDRLGIADNTIVILTSDNGGHMYKLLDDDVTATNNFPLKGGKGTSFEGGNRVPLIVRWPGHFPQGRTDETTAITGVDFYPTLMTLTGAKAPEDLEFDGVDVTDAFKGKPMDRGAVFNHFPHSVPTTNNIGGTMMVDGKWKLSLLYGNGPKQSDRLALYDLENDIGETTDVAGRYPEVVKRMEAEMLAWLIDNNALISQPNPKWNGRERAFRPIEHINAPKKKKRQRPARAQQNN